MLDTLHYYSTTGLDNVSVSLLLPDYNQSMSDLSSAALHVGQMNLGLFGNLSIVPLLGLEASETESVNGTSINFNVSSDDYAFSSSDATQSNALNQSSSVLSSSIGEINADGTQAMLQEMLHSDLADDFDFSDYMDDGKSNLSVSVAKF